MARSTATANVKIPISQIEAARNQWPEIESLSYAQMLKFALAIALGSSRADAIKATRDARLINSESKMAATQ